MAYDLPPAADLQARYPAFANVDTTLIDAVIAEASRAVGKDWAEADYQPGIMALAAHMMVREGALGDQKASGPVVSRSFDGMSVAYAQTVGVSSSELETTPYGRNYLRLLRANVAWLYLLNGSC